MCGVAGYLGPRNAVNIVFEGLQKLEYRGYDSAGIACHTSDGGIALQKSKGKLAVLRSRLSELPENAKVAIGHTRWATHGPATTENAHPHKAGGVALIHNGIIENFRELKEDLVAKGVQFKSETDTEVILHLYRELLGKVSDSREALILLSKKLHGAFSLGIIDESDPSKVHIMKQGSPMVIGVGDGEMFFASDALALSQYTNKIVFLNDGEMGELTVGGYVLFDEEGNEYSRDAQVLATDQYEVGKGGYKHFMLKEIFEQPAVLSKTVSRLIDFESSSFHFDALGLSGIDLSKVKNIHIIGCGTAYLAGAIGRYVMESVANIPCQVELASEFRYREPCLSEGTLVIPITQSGETADTLASVVHAKESGCQALAICNVAYSSIPRASDSTLYMEAGAEIGVASTKAFTSQVLCLVTLAYAVAEKNGVKTDKEEFLNELKRLPNLCEKMVSASSSIEEISRSYYESTSCLFIGRHLNSSIAYEGALKLKEISYIHAEGYPGGELKHGPIALIDRHMPVVAIAPKDRHYEKMISNIEEVRAREGRILGLGVEGDEKFESLCEHFIGVPHTGSEPLQAIVNVIALQLFSYHVAVLRGTDVDQPRNLAKSVTVE